MPLLDVSPQVALVDEKICITASGLRPLQKVTLRTWLKERSAVYYSCGQFVADHQGCVDTGLHSSHGGTYTGIESMGLFWSLKQAQLASKKIRLIKTDVTTPLVFELSLLDDHVDFEDMQQPALTTLATTPCHRWFKHPNVRRTVIREDSLRGTMFLPQGCGPFPGVIDMFGISGGLFETRAALLASRGFATLALGYIGYDDLPTTTECLDANYFTTAVDWLSSRTYVQSGGVGVVGLCKGGELAFLLGTISDKVKAIVNVSGSPVLSHADITKDGETYMKALPLQESKFQYTEEGISSRDCFPDLPDVMLVRDSCFPVWQNDARILYMVGDDDKTWKTKLLKSIIEETWPLEKKKNIEIVIYPGAGHLIEPPYMPLCRSSWFTKGLFFLWGGRVKGHAAAQEDAWRRLLQFLHQHLDQKHRLSSRL